MRFLAALACAFLIQVSGAVAQDAASPDPRLAPMDAHYARLAQAYAERDAAMVLAYRTPDFFVDAPGGVHLDAEAAQQIVLAFISESSAIEAQTQVRCASMVSDTEARFVVTQHVARNLDNDGAPQRVQSDTTQTETWRLTPEGWRFAGISNIVAARSVVDGVETSAFTSPEAANACPSATDGASAAVH